MVEAKKFICIVCPNSCEIETDGVSADGALCKRGQNFAIQEYKDPKRVITTTVRTKASDMMIPIKTVNPVSLADIPLVMAKIKKVHIDYIPEVEDIINADGTVLSVTGEIFSG